MGVPSRMASARSASFCSVAPTSHLSPAAESAGHSNRANVLSGFSAAGRFANQRRNDEMRRLRFVPFASLTGILAFAIVASSAGAAEDAGGAKVAWLRIVGIIQPEGIVGRPPGGASCE